MRNSTFRLLFGVFGVFGVSLAAMAIADAAPAPAPTIVDGQAATLKPKANPPVVFAQAQSDLEPDPAARFGQLPNGMTYVIYPNKTPPGAASVWMRVAAGSVMEQEDQRGLAHFIEHMAFNGSKNVPEGEMIKLLERDGLAFGADTNAQTEAFQTVYKLDLPNASKRIVGDALFLMRETASNLIFNPVAIDRERGVVLGEERARGNPDSRAYEARTKQLFPGTKYPERLPIGKIDIIRSAQRPAFVRFYDDFYRPEYTTLIVVGDIDPDKIEAEIRQRFSDWRPAPPSSAVLTDFGTLAPRTAPQAQVFAADGLTDTMMISWVSPALDLVETKAKAFNERLFAIANAILNERFSRAAKDTKAAFADAGVQRDEVRGTGRVYSLGIRPKDGQARAALVQAMAVLREYLANGPTRAELERALIGYDSAYRGAVATARTIPSQAIAGLIVQALETQGVVQSPAQASAAFEAARPAVTLAAIRAVLGQIRIDAPPVLWRQGTQAPSFDDAAMLAAYRSVMAAPMTTAAERPGVVWPYTRFGVPSAIVSRAAVPGVDATRVTFANGVVLTVKSTRFEDDIVHVAVQVGNGTLGLGKDDGATLFLARQVGLAAGGLGKLASDDIREALAGKNYSLDFAIGNNAAALNGSTTRSDLAVQLQVLAAFMTDAAFNPDALERLKADVPASFDAARTTPDGVFALKASGDPYDDDPRFSTPSQRDALAVGNDRVTALLKNQIGHGPVDVTIVGDITVEEAIRQVGATLGALPPLPAAVAVPNSDRLRFPTGNLHRIYTHDGRPDQNLSVIAWPTTDYYADPRRAAALDLLAAVMTLRELDEVREKQGASYSANASSTMSRNSSDFGFIISRASVAPDFDDTYYKIVSAIADDLKRHPVTRDEMTRARLPLIDRLHNEKNSNPYWLDLLSGTIRDPRQIAAAAARERDLLSITPRDIQMQARTYLDMSRALRVQIKPKGTRPI